MTAITPVIPRQKVPALKVKTVSGGTWDVAEQSPENFTLLVVYRGLHCPICKGYLTDLQRKLGDFQEKGVNVVAISSDTQERAETTKEEWGIDELTLGYGLDLDTARKWGLFISTSNGKTSAGVV